MTPASVEDLHRPTRVVIGLAIAVSLLAGCTTGNQGESDAAQPSPTANADASDTDDAASSSDPPQDATSEEDVAADENEFVTTFVVFGELQADANQLNRYVMPSIGVDPQQAARDCVNEVLTDSNEVYCWVFPSRDDFEAAGIDAGEFDLLCWTHSAGAGVTQTVAEDRLPNPEIEYGCPSASEDTGDEGLVPQDTQAGDADTCAGYTSWFLSDPTPEYVSAMRGWAEVAEDPALAAALRRNADLAENDRSAWNTDFDVTERCNALGF